jgi:hypothetical protein
MNFRNNGYKKQMNFAQRTMNDIFGEWYLENDKCKWHDKTFNVQVLFSYEWTTVFDCLIET